MSFSPCHGDMLRAAVVLQVTGARAHGDEPFRCNGAQTGLRPVCELLAEPPSPPCCSPVSRGWSLGRARAVWLGDLLMCQGGGRQAVEVSALSPRCGRAGERDISLGRAKGWVELADQ